MNWREFIKPSLKKIIATIIILTILSFLPLLPLIRSLICIQGPCAPSEEVVYFQISLFSEIFISGLAGVALLIAYAVVSYLISCLIFTLTEKKTK